MKAQTAKPGGRPKARVGPKDFEATLYPLLQREAGTKRPANCWEVFLSADDAQILTLDLAARFAFDALEHFAMGDPRLGEAYLNGILVIADSDEAVKPGELIATAETLGESELSARRARASVTNRGIGAPSRSVPASRVLNSKSRTLNKGEHTMGIKNFLSGLQGKAPANRTAMSNAWASPDDIIQNTLAEIDDKAMNWPDGKDLPDRVVIYLSQADFSRYGPRKQASEIHIENKILDYAQECGALLECDPSVTIKVDPLLYCGQMRIDATFSDPNAPAPAPTVKPAAAQARPVRNGQPAASTNPLSGNAANACSNAGPGTAPTSGNACVTPVPKPNHNPHTPEFNPGASSACAIAKLVSDTFQSAVLPNDTIGRVRYHDRPLPTIALDGADFEFVSQDQGTFEHDRDGWWFTSVGRNGTSVQRKGVWTKLPDGARFALEDGDCLSFGKCTPLTFSITQ